MGLCRLSGGHRHADHDNDNGQQKEPIMATLTSQAAARTASGNDLTLSTASDGGDDFVTTGKECLLVVSAHGDAATCSVTVTQTVDSIAVDDKDITVGAGETALLGPWPKNIYGDGDDKVTVDFGVDYADISLAVIEL